VGEIVVKRLIVLSSLIVNEDDNVLVDVIVPLGVYDDVKDEEGERVNKDDPVSDFVSSALTVFVDNEDSVADTESV